MREGRGCRYIDRDRGPKVCSEAGGHGAVKMLHKHVGGDFGHGVALDEGVD